MNQSIHPIALRERCRRGAALACLIGAAAAPGCRSYEPQPLDLPGHAARWPSTALDQALVLDFAERLAGESAPGQPFDPADGLALGEAEAVCLVMNPELRRVRQQAQVALAGAREAGRWDDPHFEADVLRFVESVDDPWILGAGLGFTVPLSGRLPVERDAAWAGHRAAWEEIALQERRTLAALREGWARWSAALAWSEAIGAYLERLDPMESTAARLAEAGEITTVDARLFAIERVVRRAERQQAEAATAARRLEVMRLLGLAPGAPVDLVPSVGAEGAPELAHAATAPAEAALDHPSVRLAAARYEQAEHELHLAMRRQRPDLTIGPAYELEEGQSRIGLGLGLPIPIFNGNRQAIAEAEARREAARLDAEVALEQALHEIAAAAARLDAATARLALLRDEVSPLIDEQIESVRSLAELGELDVLLIQEVLARSLEVRRQIIEAALDEALARVELHALAAQRTIEPAPQTQHQGDER